MIYGLFALTPISSRRNVRPERNLERDHAFHAILQQRLHPLDFVLRRFDDQFVVYLQDQPRAQVFRLQLFARPRIIASLIMSAAVP